MDVFCNKFLQKVFFSQSLWISQDSSHLHIKCFSECQLGTSTNQAPLGPTVLQIRQWAPLAAERHNPTFPYRLSNAYLLLAKEFGSFELQNQNKRVTLEN
jgi:hypothetical protein